MINPSTFIQHILVSPCGTRTRIFYIQAGSGIVRSVIIDPKSKAVIKQDYFTLQLARELWTALTVSHGWQEKSSSEEIGDNPLTTSPP